LAIAGNVAVPAIRYREKHYQAGNNIRCSATGEDRALFWQSGKLNFLRKVNELNVWQLGITIYFAAFKKELLHSLTYRNNKHI